MTTLTQNAMPNGSPSTLPSYKPSKDKTLPSPNEPLSSNALPSTSNIHEPSNTLPSTSNISNQSKNDPSSSNGDSPSTSNNGTDDINVTINLSELSNDTAKILLHTASTMVGDKELKIIIDQGSDATIITKSCVKKLGLVPKDSTKILNIKTLTGKKQASSRSVNVKFNNTEVHAYVLDSDLTLEPRKVNLSKIWPTLDIKLAKSVRKNIVDGRIDMVIGVDQLYGKISNTKTIPHPEKGLALLSTIFGYSIGGSMSNKFENVATESPNLHVLTTSYQSTEPTQLGHTETEHDIQEMMTKLFKNEDESDKSNKSVDEKHAEDLFKSNLKFYVYSSPVKKERCNFYYRSAQNGPPYHSVVL